MDTVSRNSLSLQVREWVRRVILGYETSVVSSPDGMKQQNLG